MVYILVAAAVNGECAGEYKNAIIRSMESTLARIISIDKIRIMTMSH